MITAASNFLLPPRDRYNKIYRPEKTAVLLQRMPTQTPCFISARPYISKYGVGYVYLGADGTGNFLKEISTDGKITDMIACSANDARLRKATTVIFASTYIVYEGQVDAALLGGVFDMAIPTRPRYKPAENGHWAEIVHQIQQPYGTTIAVLKLHTSFLQSAPRDTWLSMLKCGRANREKAREIRWDAVTAYVTNKYDFSRIKFSDCKAVRV